VRRRDIIVLIAGLLMPSLGAPARGQRPAKLRRVGLLFGGPSGTPVIAPLRQGLQELGGIEGQNLAIDCRFADNS